MKFRTSQSAPAIRLLFSVTLLTIFGWGGVAGAQNTTIFGPNVYVFTPSNSVSSINSTLNTLNVNTQFSNNRYAVLFSPGTYTGVEAEVGYYESVAGLGESPSAVHISNGYLNSNQTDSNGNLTTNFWRSIENMQVTAPSGSYQWGVSQGAAFRRMLVDNSGGLQLTNSNCGEASGGFISDSEITGTVNACSQQQWYTRNSSVGKFEGYVWNFVFSGVEGAPAQSNPFSNGANANTTLATTPVSREKPYLYIDSSGNYNVFVPTVLTNSSGTDWSANGGLGTGYSLAISTFLIATPSTSLATINTALASGQNLILTPGIYQYNGSINVTNPKTVVLGLGYANLIPQSGTAAITVADVEGVQLAGLLIDAGPVNSPVLLQVGVAGGSRVSHASDPASLNDVFFRIGGATAGTATTALEIDSDNVILDNIWAWRADHGTDASWTGNVAMHGLVVNGDNVTALGLAVEHFEEEQVQWFGEGGETIFYQSEMPYDVPSESAWMDDGVEGYASYNVEPTVTSHLGYGIGVYSYFNQGVNIIANSGIAAPVAAGVKFTDALSVWLAGSGSITYTIASNNGTVDNGGTTAQSGAILSDVSSWGGSAGSCTAAPTVPGTPSGTGTSSSAISVTWGTSTAGSSCTLSYNLFRSTTSGFTASSTNQIASGLPSALFVDSGLSPSTTYYYIVEAADAVGPSAASPQGSGTTLGVTCAAVTPIPTGLLATTTSSSAIGLSWTAPTPPANCTVSSYNVYGGTTANPTTVIASGVTGTTYTNTGLTASTTYYYIVKAVDAFGTSAASIQASTETLANGDFIAIASGGPAESNASGGDASFIADVDFSGGGDNTHTTKTINLSQPGANAAPMAVYQYGRGGATTYTIPGLVAGSQHAVLLHFSENYYSAKGKRVFNVAINGATVLSNFDIYATAGAEYTALEETFTATANSAGDIVIAFTDGTANQPLIMGIEVR
jgi:fibronectin type 3 domain-containing protein